MCLAPLTLLIYGFFFFRYDGDPESCIASEDTSVLYAIPRDQLTGTRVAGIEDIGKSWRNYMDILFQIEACLVAIAALFLIFKGVCADLMFPLVSLSNNILTFVGVFVSLYSLSLRFTHQGQVCSGVYLQTGDSQEGYMIIVGLYFLISGYLLMLSCGCFCCGLCCLAVAASQNRRYWN